MPLREALVTFERRVSNVVCVRQIRCGKKRGTAAYCSVLLLTVDGPIAFAVLFVTFLSLFAFIFVCQHALCIINCTFSVLCRARLRVDDIRVLRSVELALERLFALVRCDTLTYIKVHKCAVFAVFAESAVDVSCFSGSLSARTRPVPVVKRFKAVSLNFVIDIKTSNRQRTAVCCCDRWASLWRYRCHRLTSVQLLRLVSWR